VATTTTYLGGALFCAIAQVRIHHGTSNRYGPQDTLRAILAAGGETKQVGQLSAL
jgi:hypothetical protein